MKNVIKMRDGSNYSWNEFLSRIKYDENMIKDVVNLTERICLRAAKKNGWIIKFVEKQTEPMCLKAVSQNGLTLQHVKNQTEKICLEAVKQNGLALEFVENQTLGICKFAVDENLDAVQYVKINSEEYKSKANGTNPESEQSQFTEESSNGRVDWKKMGFGALSITKKISLCTLSIVKKIIIKVGKLIVQILKSISGRIKTSLDKKLTSNEATTMASAAQLTVESNLPNESINRNLRESNVAIKNSQDKVIEVNRSLTNDSLLNTNEQLSKEEVSEPVLVEKSDPIKFVNLEVEVPRTQKMQVREVDRESVNEILLTTVAQVGKGEVDNIVPVENTQPMERVNLGIEALRRQEMRIREGANITQEETTENKDSLVFSEICPRCGNKLLHGMCRNMRCRYIN